MKERSGISAVLLILLLLVSAIFGGLLSYLWVMSSYYNMPVNSTILVVENAQFSAANFSYFNVTVLNPSNSASGVNISSFRLTVETTNQTYDVNTTEYPPSLPFLLARGSRQTFKCIYNWGSIAGETLRIDCLPTNISTISNTYTLPYAALKVTPTFDWSTSVNYFNLAIENPPESSSLNISDISIFSESVASLLTPALPYLLPNNQSVTFLCHRSWQDLQGENVTLTVSTTEGYETSYTTSAALPEADLSLVNATFDYSNTGYFNVTFYSSEDSTVPVTLSGMNLTLANESISLPTVPPLNITGGIPMPTNQSLILRCLWNWSLVRDEKITVQAYTSQNFTVTPLTVTTPSSTVWNITNVNFDFDDPTQFWVNVTNTPCSTNNITVTAIQLNDQNTTLDQPSTVITPGTQTMFRCALNWTDFIGQTANITVLAADGSNVSTSIAIPTAQLKILGDLPVYGDMHGTSINVTIPYFNVTIENCVNSRYNLTITSMILEADNVSQDLAESVLYPNASSSLTYVISPGETITFVCYSENNPYLKSSTTIELTVYTAEGIQASKTWQQQT
jgi:hypothetical protein